MQPTNTTGTIPQAYLTILFFDERFNFISASDGGAASLQITGTTGASGSSLTLANVKAPKNGYAYAYVSNRSNADVYFDNFKVQVAAGNIIEENHYYAYGLKIASISSVKLGDGGEGGLKNNNLYNDKELIDDADLNWYDYGFRSYDPQIGRFPQLDPLTDSYPFLTPYQYASNDPITNIDVDGLEGIVSIGGVLHKAVGPTGGFLGTIGSAFGNIMSITSLAIHAIGISSDVVRQQIITKTTNHFLSSPDLQQKLAKGVWDFYNANKQNMSLMDYLTLSSMTQNYFEGLNLMAWWNGNDFDKLDRTVISNTSAQSA